MKWLKYICAFGIVALLLSQLDNPVLIHITDKNWLVDYIHQNGLSGDVVIFISSVVFLAIGGPKQVIALIFGYLYHIYIGSFVALSACIAAAIINYMVAHFLLARWLFRRFPNRMRKFNAFAIRSPFFKILLLRLFPIGSNVITNVLSGSVQVPLLPFFSASALGYLPQTIIFALAGAGINAMDNHMIYLSIFLAVASTVLTGFIYRDHIKNRVDDFKTDPLS